MSLLFHTLSRLFIAFLPRSKHFLISWLQSPSAGVLEPKKRKSVTTPPFSSSICYEVMVPDAMILYLLIFNLSQIFDSPPSPLSRSSLVPPHFLPLVVSSRYLRLLIFLPPILIPACNSSNPAFLMRYSVYRLNKQDDSRQPWHTPFSILGFPASSAGKESFDIHLSYSGWGQCSGSIRLAWWWAFCLHPEFPEGSPSGCNILCLLTWQASFLVNTKIPSAAFKKVHMRREILSSPQRDKLHPTFSRQMILILGSCPGRWGTDSWAGICLMRCSSPPLRHKRKMS